MGEYMWEYALAALVGATAVGTAWAITWLRDTITEDTLQHIEFEDGEI